MLNSTIASGEANTMLFITISALHGEVIPFVAHWIFPSKVNRNKNYSRLQNLLFRTQNENTAQLWIISALIASSWSQIRCFILANVLRRRIFAQVWPDKHYSRCWPFFVLTVNSLTWQNPPEGGYDEKNWNMACNWLIMTSSAEVWD